MSLLETNPEVMTTRARIYLIVSAIAQLAMTYVCLFQAHFFQSPSYEQIKHFSHSGWTGWGAFFGVASILCLASSVGRRAEMARWALVLTATGCGFWGGGYIAAGEAGNLSGPTGPIFLLWLSAIHVIMCANPIRTPFERIVRRLLGANPVRR